MTHTSPVLVTRSNRLRPGVLLLALLAALLPAWATDGQPILDLGRLSWVDYQKRQLLAQVTDVKLEGDRINPGEAVVSIYQPVVFQNLDDKSHRLVFMPDLGNKMDQAYTSVVLRPEERWGAEFHDFGRFPFRCTVHPEERGEISVIL